MEKKRIIEILKEAIFWLKTRKWHCQLTKEEIEELIEEIKG